MSSSSGSTICSSVCASLANIIKQNNDGIRRLETQDYSKAASLLSAAVADLKVLLAQSGDNDATTPLDRPCYELVFSFVLHSAVGMAGSASDHHGEASNSSQSGFVFEAPIKVSKLRREHSCKGEAAATAPEDTITEMLKRLSFSVVYNLAVAFHMSAVHNHSASLTNKKLGQRLRKAQAFYQMALDLAKEYHIAVGSMEALAIANNQAHIYRLLNQQEDAEKCRQMMLCNIMYVQEQGNSKDIVQFEKFVASATMAASQTTAKAA